MVDLPTRDLNDSTVLNRIKAELTASVSRVSDMVSSGTVRLIGLFKNAGDVFIENNVFIVSTSGHTRDGIGQAFYRFDSNITTAMVTQNPRHMFMSKNGRGFRLVAALVDVRMFGALGDGLTDDTLAIQAAIDSKVGVLLLPTGEYLHAGLSFNTPFQRLYGPGSKLTRTDPTATIKINKVARGVHFVDLILGCRQSGMAGDNLTVMAPDFVILDCDSIDCAGVPLFALNTGGGLRVRGGNYQTTSSGPDAYDIVVKHDEVGTNSLYCWITEVNTNTHGGGIKFDGPVSTSGIESCQFGKSTMINGGSAWHTNCRIGGVVNVQSGFVKYDKCNFNDDVLVGTDGSSDSIGSVSFGPGNMQKAGKTFKISNNVKQSIFFLNQLCSSGSQVVINSYDNDIWHPELPISIGIGAQSGNPTFGNAVLNATMSSSGRRKDVSLDLAVGFSSNFGGGNFFYFSLPFKAKSSATCPVSVEKPNVGFCTWTGRILKGDNKLYFFQNSSSSTFSPINVSATSPFTIAEGDKIVMSLGAEIGF